MAVFLALINRGFTKFWIYKNSNCLTWREIYFKLEKVTELKRQIGNFVNLSNK